MVCRWWMRAGRGGQRGFHCKTKAGWPTTISAHLQLTKKERVLITDMQLGTARSLSEAKLEQILFQLNTIKTRQDHHVLKTWTNLALMCR